MIALLLTRKACKVSYKKVPMPWHIQGKGYQQEACLQELKL